MSPPSDETSTGSSSPEDMSNKANESSWSLNYSSTKPSSKSEAELYHLDVLSQVLTKSMKFMEDGFVLPARTEGVLRLVQFGPTLTERMKIDLRNLVIEYVDLFVTRHQDLLNITLEEHKIK
jgi:hypothetical protein